MTPATLGPVYVLLAWIYGFVGTASLIAIAHPRLRRPGAKRVQQAILSWVPVSLVGGLAVVTGRWGAVAIFAAVSAAALREFLSFRPASDAHPVLDALAYLTVPLHYAAVMTAQPALIYGGILAWAGLVLPLARMWCCGTEDFTAASARTLFGLVLTVLGLSHVVIILLGPRGDAPAVAVGAASLLMLLVTVSDASQYVAGKLLGKRPLAPSISPGKTLEGLLGGAAVSAVVGAAAAPLVTAAGRVAGAGIGIGLCLIGVLGDLLVSALKRDARVKDSGTALPGQGGVLDRCDSLLVAAPLYFCLWLALA